ncbi:efflux RND transporter periplasmic adaptor subunit [Buttiauxella brennerae]|uniref:efflux RND transporter periplasmic adaptor subunit n=1 Tax=Buttiauxella brennerae TaxID=82988 RepID=UPI00286F0D97|nr:efflux RND transporter periplasmic adaptor subunit [Buttiauxella brennerae]
MNFYLNPVRHLLWPILIVSSALTIVGCNEPSTTASSVATTPKPSQVTYRQMEAVDIPRVEQLSGRVVAFQTSEVRPQVNGIIMERLFNEGDKITKGQPLYRLDPRLYAAAVKQAEANLNMTRASASVANSLVTRYAPLVKTQNISQQEYTTAVANAQQAQAAIAQAAALLDTAKINLEFATITAPIDGKIGRSFYTAGALVTANQDNSLATIQQLDPVYIDIQQTSAELLAMHQRTQSGKTIADRVPVQLTLEGGVPYAQQGTLEFSEAVVDPATGSVTLRARFPNPQNILLPGMFVQASLSRTTQEQAFLVPQAALQRDAKGESMVYVIDEENKVSLKHIITQGVLQQDWVVTAGLESGDKVLTKGLVRVRVGDVVNAQPEAALQQTAANSSNVQHGG